MSRSRRDSGQLTGHTDPLPVGVLVPEEVLTIGELAPGLAEAGITVVEEPTADRSGPGGKGLAAMTFSW